MKVNNAQDFLKMVGGDTLHECGLILQLDIICSPILSYTVIHPAFNMRISYDDKELEMFDNDDICGVYFESSLEGAEGFSASIAFPFEEDEFNNLLEEVNDMAMDRYYQSNEVKQMEMGL